MMLLRPSSVNGLTWQRVDKCLGYAACLARIRMQLLRFLMVAGKRT